MLTKSLPALALFFVALIAGAIASLGFEPTAMWLLTVIGVTFLVAMVDTAATSTRAALLGWGFGIGHFTTGLGWIATAFSFQSKMPAVLGWVSVVLLSMFLALYIGMAAYLARRLVRGAVPRVLMLAAAWMLAFTLSLGLLLAWGLARSGAFPFGWPLARRAGCCFPSGGSLGAGFGFSGVLPRRASGWTIGLGPAASGRARGGGRFGASFAGHFLFEILGQLFEFAIGTFQGLGVVPEDVFGGVRDRLQRAAASA